MVKGVATSIITVAVLMGSLVACGGTTQNVTIPMPNVVCMVMEEAQDHIKSRGISRSSTQDDSGEDRPQLPDGNWIVARQNPAAGEPIGERDAMLYVVKKWEHWLHYCPSGTVNGK